MRVSELIAEAQSTFEALTKTPLSTDASSTVAEQQTRFTDWLKQVGADAAGKDSLDYSLRDSVRLQGTVSELLEDLVGELNEYVSIVEARSRGSAYHTRNLTQSGSDSESTERPAISVADSSATHSTPEPSPESELLQDVEETVNLLERLVKTLLDHEPHDHMEQEFVERVQQSETQDSWKVHRRFPDAAVYIQQRLGKSIAKRRAILFYHIKRKFPHEHMESIEGSVETFLFRIRTFLDEMAERDDQQDTRSSSGMSTSSEDTDTAAGTDCTLCDQPVNTGDYRLFRKHLCEDLEPYVCLYQDCPSPERLYRSRAAWTEHVKFVHGAVWRCCFGCTQTFGVRTSFEAHLNEVHGGRFTKRELPSLADLCEKHVLLDEDMRCPLCKDVTSSGNGRQRHIGKHMEDLALCALELVDGPDKTGKTNYGYPIVKDDETASVTSQNRTRTTGGSSVPSTRRTSIAGDDEDHMSNVASRSDGKRTLAERPALDRSRSSPQSDYDAATHSVSPTSKATTLEDDFQQYWASLQGPEDRDVFVESKPDTTKLPPQRSRRESWDSGSSDSGTSYFKIAGEMSGRKEHRPAHASTTTVDANFSSTTSSTARPTSYATKPRISGLIDLEASCAICGAPPYPECPHEGQRLQLALDQALERWGRLQATRDWVLNHSRDQVLVTFQELKAARYEAHLAYLQTLPTFSLYQKYHGNPPIQPSQLAVLHSQINHATSIFKAGIDEDWRRSCLRYPEVLDYYFSLVEVDFPHEQDPAIREPRFGSALKEIRKLNKRRGSVDLGHRKKDRRRSRARTPPPAAPMTGSYNR